MNPSPRSADPRPVMNRRDLLRAGGLTLSLGAIVAACGDRGGPSAPGRLGVAPPPATLPAGTVDDLVLLRTAQSLHHTAVAVHEALLERGVLTGDDEALVARLIDDHRRSAATIGELVGQAGGEAFACPNPFVMERAVEPTLAAIDADNVLRDVLSIAHAFEAWIGASHQALVSALSEPSLRRAVMQVGAESLRHATVLARLINPDQTFAPTFQGGVDEPDDEGFPVPYAIPSTFGRVSGIDVVVGPRNEEGQRFSVQLQTPAANTFVYDTTSC